MSPFECGHILEILISECSATIMLYRHRVLTIFVGWATEKKILKEGQHFEKKKKIFCPIAG